MSSGQGRVDVEVESKRPDEPTQSADHPNTCPGCGSHYRDDELEQALRVCPHCGHHFRVGARERIEQLVDPGSFAEEDEDLRSADPLGFFDLRPYTERLAAYRGRGVPARGHGLRLHGRLDGGRRRREVRAGV